MEYQLIPIPGDGNCLFRSVSHLIFGTQEEHRNIRLRVVNLMLMSLDGEYAGHVELECISRFYSNHTFRVYRSNDLNEFVDYGSGVTMGNLFFSGNGDAGHYSVLVFGNNMNIQNSFILPKEITANTNSKRKTHSLTGRRERKKYKETRNHSSPKLLLITITQVLLWNLIFCQSKSVELNKDSELLCDRVRYSTYKCDCLKNRPPVVDHNNYEPLTGLYGVDNFENLGLAKDSSKPSYPVKRHAILRCHNRPALENNKPYKPNLITSEWKMKSTPVDNAYGDLMVKKSKVVGLKKIEINSQKMNHEPLHRTLPLLQKGNLVSENPKHSLLPINLQDKANQIKSLTFTPQHRLDEIISDKLVDETLHNKPTQPSLTLPLPYKSIKYPVNNQLIQPTEIHNNIDTAGLITDSDKQSNPLKLSQLLPHIPNNQNDLKNKPFSTFSSVQFNQPKPVDILLRDRSPSQLIQTPAIKPIHLPIIVQKEVSLSVNERPQANIDSSSQYPKIIKNGIAESTSQPIVISLSHNKQEESIDFPPSKSIKSSDTETVNKPITIIEKKVSIYYPHQKPQDSIDLSPPKQFMKISNPETEHKPIKIEKKEISISAPNEQKQPIIDLPPQAPQLIKTT
ncbi:uncharacterized protein LOC132938958 [Metopolophium dirhodum]|uniref:uncharacterized protein LOC132938931 n=1 Tax=Metopolophium dirhodum TaxID=44670 RepID=UPI00298F62A5|nr:uncharacterized protein LOC132938931 [Metopolophium dirhodum]XP_060861918.1 uncharacterized protein LOC132938958 [Metopolophium dirhodum]